MRKVLARRMPFATTTGLLVALAVVVGSAGTAVAQEEEPDGRISGRVIAGTEGASTDGVAVRLIILEESRVTGSEETAVADGQFEFAVPARSSRTYIPYVRHQGIQYFGDPVILAPEEPEARREITIYETTDEAPELRILATVVTVLALDRQGGQIALQREDLIETPGDRVFVGDEAGVTLRLPAPENTLDAAGINGEGGATLEGGVLSTTVPMRPDDLTSVITRYIVQYDPADDRYLLRVTAPVRAEHIEARIPQGFAHRLEPREGAERGEDVIEEELEGQVMHTVVLEGGAEPGRGLLVELVGLSGRQESLILTERHGATIAAAGALALISGAALAVLRRRGAAA